MPTTGHDLQEAIAADDPSAVRSALAAGAEATDEHVRQAVAEAGADVVRALLDAGASVEAPGEPDDDTMFVDGDETLLMTAAYRGRLDVLEVLLEAGADVASVDAQGNTPLCYAAMGGHRAIVDRLLAARADPNQPADFHPLFYAASGGDAALVGHLVAQGAEVDRPIWTGVTALVEAAAKPCDAVVERLLEAGADVRLTDRDGRDALLAAAGTGASDLVAHLLDHGASADTADREGTTPLMRSAHRGATEAVVRLLEEGATVQRCDSRGRTALHHGVGMNRPEVVEQLLVAGADVEVEADDGRRALGIAAQNGYTDLMALLLAHGADPEATTPDGLTARDLAVQFQRDEAVRLLDGRPVPLQRVPEAIQASIASAQAALSAGRYAEALPLFQSVPAEQAARILAVPSGLGYCHQQLGDHAEAIACFEAALALDPSRVHLWKATCYSLFALQRWDDMAACASRATELAPDDGYGWQQLGIAAAQRGDRATALTANERAVELDPDNGYALFNLAYEQHLAGHDDPVATFARAFARAPALIDHARTDEDLADLRQQPGFLALLGD